MLKWLYDHKRNTIIVKIDQLSNFKLFSYSFSVWYRETIYQHYFKSSTGRMYVDNITAIRETAAN